MKSRSIYLSALALTLSVGTFVSCSSSTSTSTTGSDSTKTQAVVPPAQSSNDLIAGQWCYAFEDESISLTAVMEYDGKSKVSGAMYGDIHDKAESYFTSYTTDFEGIREGGNLKVKTKTEIEGDAQEGDETWTWDGKTLTEGLHKMEQVDCEPSPED